MEKVNKYGAPSLSLIFSSVLTSIVLILLPKFTSVSLIASITAIVPYSAAILSVPILRVTKKDAPRPFKLPAYHLFSFCFDQRMDQHDIEKVIVIIVSGISVELSLGRFNKFLIPYIIEH